MTTTRKALLTALQAALLLTVFTLPACAANSPTLSSEFFRAVKCGDMEAAHSLLAADASLISATNSSGRTALHMAAWARRRDMTLVLLGMGADPDAADERAYTPLHLAAWAGCPEIADALIEAGADVDARKDDGETPLHVAARSNHAAVMDVIISRGADVAAASRRYKNECTEAFEKIHNACVCECCYEYDYCGRSPIFEAAEAGATDALALLIARGASASSDGWPPATKPLHAAAAGGRVAEINLLVQRGANIEAVDAYGATPLMYAVANDHRAAAALLLSMGAAFDTSRCTPPLIVAARSGNSDVLALLADAGADIDSVDDDYGSPLMAAASYGKADAVSMLLARHIRIDVEEEGNSLLCAAARHGMVDLFDRLLALGVSVNCTEDTCDESPLHCAVEGEHDELITRLLDLGADIEARDPWGRTPLWYAARNDATRIGRLLVERGADIEAADDWGNTILLNACYMDNPTFVTFLITMGADVTATSEEGASVIFYAVAEGYRDLLDLVMAKGADINAVDSNGCTLFAPAAWSGVEMMQYLLDKGADMYARDHFGNNALYWAVESDNVQAVRFLLDRGIDALSKNEDGLTPLDLVEYYCGSDITQAFAEHGFFIEES